MLTASGLEVLTSEFFPTFCNSRNQISCIDIAMGTPGMKTLFTDRITNKHPTLSDHAVWELELLQPTSFEHSGGYKYKSVDWSALNEYLQAKLGKLKPPMSEEDYDHRFLDRYVDQFSDIIKEMIKTKIPWAKSRQETTWWSPALTQLKNRVIEGKACETDLQEEIKKAKETHWNQFIEASRTLGDAHLRKRLCSLDPHSTNPATVRKADGSYTTSSLDTANHLLNQWFRFPVDDKLKTKFSGYYEKV